MPRIILLDFERSCFYELFYAPFRFIRHNSFFGI